jgi:hypothetical protein
MGTFKLQNCSLDELNRAANCYHLLHFSNGGASEFDQSINDISRAKIKALFRDRGSCFLYKLNKWHKTDPDVWEYTGQKIYNFDCSFITANKDEELSQMVIEYNRPREEFNSKLLWEQVEAIYDRVEKIGGIITTWV